MFWFRIYLIQGLMISILFVYPSPPPKKTQQQQQQQQQPQKKTNKQKQNNVVYLGDNCIVFENFTASIGDLMVVS
jgi:predicted histidine transporter YuiF (NhaC family)